MGEYDFNGDLEYPNYISGNLSSPNLLSLVGTFFIMTVLRSLKTN